ncbi:MAG: hypothetical protein K6G61_06010 [Solobacterium sp.]|nr:hypothetical protein [Solobacterium sp.]
MTYYGTADIGSNTIVLAVFEMKDGIPCVRKHISTPVHLIDYVEDFTMRKEGIEKAYETLVNYGKILDEMDIDIRFADITEPCRITNRAELEDRLAETGFKVISLSGEEEASCDFAGAKISFPDITEGIAFDIGGGSTELISFKNNEAVDAVSFHLGCVRLSHLPLDTPECMKEIRAMAEKYPSLDQRRKTVIGIGGTVKALAKLIRDRYGTKNEMYLKDILDIFARLQAEEPAAIEALHRCVNKDRIPVFLPGVHMIIEICRFYEAELILVSQTGIREGFMLKYVLPACGHK